MKDYVREVTEPDPRWWEDNEQRTPSGIYGPQDADPALGYLAMTEQDGFLMNDNDPIKKKEFNPQMFRHAYFGNPEADIPIKYPRDHLDYEEKYDELYWNLPPDMRRHPSHYFPGYNTVDTKYLMLTYHYSMAEKSFEMIYLMRFLLDKQRETETYKLVLPTYGGSQDHSIYDIVLFLVCGLNRLMFAYTDTNENEDPTDDVVNEYGEILQNDHGYQRIMAYNVDITDKEINAYLDRCSYLDATTIRSYIAETTLAKRSDIRSAWAVGIIGLRDYLITQMEMAETIVHWREAEKFYNMMFTYDPVRDIHAVPGLPPNPDDEYIVPPIRYRIYDMEISDFGNTIAKVGDPVRIKISTSKVNVTTEHNIICGVVGEVSNQVVLSGSPELQTVKSEVNGESGYVSRIDFHYKNPGYNGTLDARNKTLYFSTKDAYEDFHLLPYWNKTGTGWNKTEDTFIESDFNFDIGDHYNPSGSNGPEIHEGSYIANIDGVDTELYIRVTTSRFHTKDLYEYYIDELQQRDPILASYISGSYSDKEMGERLTEACDILSEAIDIDLGFLRSDINGGKDMEIYLMDMIKYIKSYTIDFITSEKKMILNDKKNPEWLRLIDQIVFDPKKPTTLVGIDVLMIYDAARHIESHVKMFDGKNTPKNEWDHDVFTKAPPHMTDSIKIYRDRPGIQYFYRIVDIKIEYFTLPEGIAQGTKFTDTFSVENSTGEPPTEILVEIYIGYNPTPGDPRESYYHDSGFTYHTVQTSYRDYPIVVCFHENKLPLSMPVDVRPIGGRIEASDKGLFVGQVIVDYVRRDVNNPQFKGA
jgi:hypothetical protein